MVLSRYDVCPFAVTWFVVELIIFFLAHHTQTY